MQKTVYIQCPLDSGTITLNIFNSSGQLVINREIASVNNELTALDVSQLATGLYTVSVKTINNSYYQKFIKF